MVSVGGSVDSIVKSAVQMENAHTPKPWRDARISTGQEKTDAWPIVTSDSPIAGQTKRYPMVSRSKMPRAFVLVSILSLFAFAPSAQALEGLPVAGARSAIPGTVLVGDRNCQSEQGNCEVKCMSAGGSHSAQTDCFQRCQDKADACADH